MLSRLRPRRGEPNSLRQPLYSLSRWLHGGTHHVVSSSIASPLDTAMKPSKIKTRGKPKCIEKRMDDYNLLIEYTSADDVFSYKAQRWLWNEPQQLQRRYLEFNLKALIQIAEDAAGPGAKCVEVTKLPEGNFNKTFLVTMYDGRQLIARLRNPNAGRPHYTTASEVATMDYVQPLSYC
jgi:hypothetical protein